MHSLQSILIPTDYSNCSQAAISYGARLAGERQCPSVTLLHVVETRAVAGLYPSLDPTMDTPISAGHREVLRQRLEEVAKDLGLPANSLTTKVLRAPHAGTGIVDYAREHRVDLIVLGTHGRRGVQRLLLGSVAGEVARRAPCPVVSVPANWIAEDSLPRRILGAVDLGDRTASVIAQVAELSELYDAEAHLAHAIEPIIVPAHHEFGASTLAPPSEAEILAMMEDAVRRSGSSTSFHYHVSSGRPARELADLALEMNADMIVVATARLKGIWRLVLGSVCARILDEAPCPVWTLHSSEELVSHIRAA